LRAQQLGEEKIAKLLLKFSIPAIVGMMVNATYNVVDRIFVGRGIGSLGIAGITLGFPIMLVTMAFAMLIGMGATSLISIRLGEQKKEEAEVIAGNAVVLLMLISVTISVLSITFLKPILIAFGASTDVLPYAMEYLTIILVGTIIMGISFGMNNFIRAEGNPRIAMYTMLIGAITNIGLDALFIFVLELGIKGAALATVLAQGVSALWVLHYFLFGKSTIKLYRRNLRLNPAIVTKIMAVGFPPFAMQLANSLQNAILNKSLSIYGGDIAISAMGVIFSIATFMIMPIIGINQGVQPIIGYNYGARQFKRVKEALKLAIIVATSIAFIGYIITRIFPHKLISLFNSTDTQLINIGTNGMLIFFFFLPIIGFQIISSNYFQAVGKPKQATILNLSRQFLLFIPALLILPKLWGLDGIWLAAPVADAGSSLITGTWLYYELKFLGQEENQPAI